MARAIHPPHPCNSPSPAAQPARPQSHGPAAQHGDPHRSGRRRHNTRPKDHNPTPDTNSRCSSNSNHPRSTLPGSNATDTNPGHAIPDDTNEILRIVDQSSDHFLESDSSG